MTPGLLNFIAGSKDVALVLSLVFNLVACGAIWRLWKSRENLQDKMNSMLTDLLKELTRLTSRLLEKE